MSLQAPAGGITSQVNGQFYEGGQFVPDHGLSCGKGKHRISAEAFASIQADFRRWFPGQEVEWNEVKAKYTVRRLDGLQTSQVFATASKIIDAINAAKNSERSKWAAGRRSLYVPTPNEVPGGFSDF